MLTEIAYPSVKRTLAVPPLVEVAQLLRAHGYNTTSYLALEADKRHYFNPDHTAALSYMLHHNITVVAGEPLCAPDRLTDFLTEYLQNCRQQHQQPLFFEVSETALPILQAQGFKFLKQGEEPFFQLSDFSLKGNRMSNVRSSAKTARNKGVTVRQIQPLREPEICQQLTDLDERWLALRGSERLRFTLGSLGLQNPGDRFYFVAECAGRVVAFVTYTPIYTRYGAYLDLMRREEDAPTGTMDLLLSESFRLLQENGVLIATMGLSPLADLSPSAVPQNPHLIKLCHWLYTNGETIYPFNSLYKFKAKFNPHWWERKYLAYRHLGPLELDAILTAITGQGLWKTTLQTLGSSLKGKS
jgi:phosphatidylglycerol lysyltransferase